VSLENCTGRARGTGPVSLKIGTDRAQGNSAGGLIAQDRQLSRVARPNYWPACTTLGTAYTSRGIALTTGHSGIPVIARKNTAMSGVLCQNPFTYVSFIRIPAACDGYGTGRR